MSVTKVDGQWSVIKDGKVVFSGPRKNCIRADRAEEIEVVSVEPEVVDSDSVEVVAVDAEHEQVGEPVEIADADIESVEEIELSRQDVS